jgi:phosphoribosylaminoimidazole carboxylase PurE protein
MKRRSESKKRKMIKVAIIMGSDSDLKIMSEAATALEFFSIKSKIQIVSAHRTPEAMYDFAKNAKDMGFEIIIAGAGGAAHLPGMVASLTTLPVIGVPVTQGKLKGLDALLSICQMPKGVPVATVAIDNAYNAGLLAARILAINDPGVAKKLNTFILNQQKKVRLMNKKLR